MSSLLSFLNMGGYGSYIWSAYGLVGGFLALQFLLPWRRWRKINQHQKVVHAQTQ